MGRHSDAKQKLMDAVLELIWTGSYGMTTIDHICARAGVKKGSFYYFFDSKCDLAAAALEVDWCRRRAQLDAIFSPTVPPLERLRNFCDSAYGKQAEMKEKCGCVLGCPLYALGSEVCTQERKLQLKIQEILSQHRKYVESAIRDAVADHAIEGPINPAEKAGMIQAYFEGMLTQARIQNNVGVLKDLPRGIAAILGLPADTLKAVQAN